MKKKEQVIEELWDNHKRYNEDMMGIRKRRTKENRRNVLNNND